MPHSCTNYSTTKRLKLCRHPAPLLVHSLVNFHFHKSVCTFRPPQVGAEDDIEELKDAAMADMADIFSKVDKGGEGVCVQVRGCVGVFGSGLVVSGCCPASMLWAVFG